MFQEFLVVAIESNAPTCIVRERDHEPTRLDAKQQSKAHSCKTEDENLITAPQLTSWSTKRCKEKEKISSNH